MTWAGPSSLGPVPQESREVCLVCKSLPCGTPCLWPSALNTREMLRTESGKY